MSGGYLGSAMSDDDHGACHPKMPGQRGCEKMGLAPGQLQRKPDEYLSRMGACPDFFTASKACPRRVSSELPNDPTLERTEFFAGNVGTAGF